MIFRKLLNSDKDISDPREKWYQQRNKLFSDYLHEVMPLLAKKLYPCADILIHSCGHLFCKTRPLLHGSGEALDISLEVSDFSIKKINHSHGFLCAECLLYLHFFHSIQGIAIFALKLS